MPRSMTPQRSETLPDSVAVKRAPPCRQLGGSSLAPLSSRSFHAMPTARLRPSRRLRMLIDPMFARKAQLAEILEAMCEALELTPSQTEEAEQHYNAVGHWLGEDSLLAGAWIYVHG